MKPQTLRLRNIRAYESAEVDLSVVSAAAIVGTNGAGKSTICEGILRALYSDGRTILPERMVRLGAEQGSIELEYEHNGNRYRVIRTAGKRADLQYLLWDPEDGAWRPLSGATAAETQEKISRDLAMDERLFLASSCVMQGHSAGICEAGPAERKQVLMQILEDRLGKFGPLHEAAKTAVKGIDSALGVARAKRAELEARVERRDDEVAAKSGAEATLANLRTELEKTEAELAILKEQAAKGQAAREKVAELERRLDDLDHEIGNLQEQIERHSHVVGQAEVLLERADDVRAQCDELATAERDLDESNRIREQYRELGQRYTTFKAELDAEGARLGHEEKAAQGRLDATVETAQDQERRAALLTEVPCHGSPMADECKLIASARKDAENASALRGMVPGIEGALRSISEQIKVHSARYAELEPLKAEAAALGWNQEAHQQLENRVAHLKPARELLPQIEGATARRDTAQAAISELNKTLAGKRLQRIGIEQDLDAARNDLGGQEDPFQEGYLESKVADLKRRMETETRALAVAEERLAQIAAAVDEFTALEAELVRQDHQRLIQATLQEAFSRDGIPALIIDAAVPEIEERANEILARLSDGRMSLKLVTQKATKTAGIAETLDIIVSDARGERAYEDWSGGERLRIDLSVRIALGQLLSARTGAKIELLILDEVCAPLDEAGEEALIDCINRLQDSFGCILLITHRESIRDRLPQQIMVSRNGTGSEVTVTA